VGDVIDPGNGAVVAGARAPGGLALRNTTASLLRGASALGPVSGAATTIGCVATDAVLDKVGCTRLAISAQDGLARTISPVHTAFDGDTIFGLATGASGIRPEGLGAVTLAAAAAQVTAMAVLRAIMTAQRVSGSAVPEVPAWADLAGHL
jgi:L-aminopeptidase/D-esterase-like protein